MARRPIKHFVKAFTLLTALAAILFASVPRPAYAQIEVSAPTDAQVRAVGAWYEQHVPARFHARGAVDVSLLTDREMAAYLKGSDPDGASHASDDGDGDIDGVFEDDPARITLRLPGADELDMLTFAHEYGHYVWFRLLSKGDRRRYATLYDRQRAAHHLVTPYAATDLEEGFAEAFSFYAGDPSTLMRRDPVSSQFLAQWTGK